MDKPFDRMLKPASTSKKDRFRIEAALRDLVWRIDHVRTNLNDPAARLSSEEIIAFLDTTCARLALGLPVGASEAVQARENLMTAGESDDS